MRHVSDRDCSPAQLDEAFHQYLRLVDDQGPIDDIAFLAAYPACAGQLRELMETADQIEEMAGPPLESAAEADASSSAVDPSLEETVVVEDHGVPSDAGTKTASGSLVGRILGDYQIKRELGRGGMGVVYLARQISMDRDVAFKMIRSGCLASESDVQRFYFEARAAGRLKHPSIVQVYQVGQIEGHHFFSMEYIEGENLARMSQEQQLSFEQVAMLVQQVAEAVDFAHQHGVLHRDLKPSNVLIDSAGRPRITDFGLAKDMAAAEHFTSSGSALGTPSYMPPEQAEARRDDVTCRSDVYSLGAILYQLITGRPPFRGDSLLETLTHVIHDEPRPPRDLNRQCPRDLEAICLKCLQKSPSGRYDTAHGLSEDLDRFLSGDRVRARRSRWYRRAWHWLRNVPFLAAALGRKTTNPTAWHVRFQWSLIALIIAGLLGMLVVPRAAEWQRMSVIDVSTGRPEGTYDRIGRSLADDLRETLSHEVRVHAAAGAVEGHSRLVSGEADLAFLQENVLEAASLKVLAPLYREAVLVIVRRDLSAAGIADLADLRIALGPPASGMRLSSERLLGHYGIDPSLLRDNDRPYTELVTDTELDGAIVTIKVDDPSLQELLRSGEFRLLPLPDSNDIPGFRSMLLREQHLPDGLIPPEGLLVPATFAILAIRSQSPDWFVESCLQALYRGDGVASQFEHVFALRQAAAWTDLNYHPAAQRYFSQARVDAAATRAPP
jgi:eukaryotic-like serine/threonine-protein kinase